MQRRTRLEVLQEGCSAGHTTNRMMGNPEGEQWERHSIRPAAYRGTGGEEDKAKGNMGLQRRERKKTLQDTETR